MHARNEKYTLSLHEKWLGCTQKYVAHIQKQVHLGLRTKMEGYKRSVYSQSLVHNGIKLDVMLSTKPTTQYEYNISPKCVKLFVGRNNKWYLLIKAYYQHLPSEYYIKLHVRAKNSMVTTYFDPTQCSFTMLKRKTANSHIYEQVISLHILLLDKSHHHSTPYHCVYYDNIRCKK